MKILQSLIVAICLIIFSNPILAQSCTYPSNETITFNGDGTATVSFPAVPDAQEYQILYRKQGTTYDLIRILSSSTSIEIYEIDPGENYEYKLRTKCGGAWLPLGAISYQSFLVPANNGNMTCTDPDDQVSFDQNDAVIITWDPIPTATNHHMVYRKKGIGGWINKYSATSEIILTGLTPNQEYEYEIRTKCGAIWLPFGGKPKSTFTVPGNTQTCTYPANESITFNGNGTATITFPPVPDAQEYQIQYRKQGSSYDMIRILSSTESIDLYEIEPGESYEYKLRTKCGGSWLALGAIPYQNFEVPYDNGTMTCTDPNEEVSFDQNGAVIITWNPMPTATNHHMVYRKKGIGGWINKYSSTTEIILSGLIPDQEYEYEIRTKCGATWLPFGGKPKSTFIAPNCDYPNTKIIYNSGGDVHFKWSDVAFATNYKFQYREKDSGSAWIELVENTNIRKLTGLTSGTEYEYRVTSECSSSWLDESSAPLKYFSVNEAPENIEVKVIATYTGTEVILRWVPTSYDSWHWGNNNGYEVVRYTLEENGQELTLNEQTQSKVILADPMLPLPEADWEPLVDTDEMAGIAAAGIYGIGYAVEDLSSTDAVAIYNVQKENENRFGFSLFAADQSFIIAEAMGLGLKDNTVATGNKYVYRVSPKNTPITTNAMMGAVTISTDEALTLIAPTNLLAESGDRNVQLSWDNMEFALHTGYDVERSDDGGNTFIRVNENPVIYASLEGASNQRIQYLDSLPLNNQEYIYRVLGKTAFGIMSPSSDTVAVIGKPKPISSIAHITTIVEEQSEQLKMNWKFDENMESKIQGFDIYRCPKKDGAYTKLNNSMLSKTTRTYTDPSPNSTNYYVIKAIDENGYEVPSFASLGQLNDETPPSAPEGLAGSCDASGMVSLTWNKNTEPDLMGYRVFMSNDLDGNYAQVTEQWIPRNNYQYKINIQTLTENVYFKVLAVDNRENFSEYSEAATIGRPDIVPPTAPVITSVLSQPSGVKLEWILSSSSDVVKHILQRKSEVDLAWQDLVTFDESNSLESYNDETGLSKYEYGYRLLAFDEAGNLASSKIVIAKPIDTGIRGEIVNVGIAEDGNCNYVGPDFEINFNNHPDKKRAMLFWSYPDIEGLYDFQIYKKINGGNLHTFKVIKAEEAVSSVGLTGSNNVVSFSFEDFEIKCQSSNDSPSNSNDGTTPDIKNNYSYVIQARFLDGGSSPLSEPVSISF